MTTLNDRMKAFIDSLTEDPVEDRITEYVIREVHNGRPLTEVISDPFVKNRLNEERVDTVLQNPEIIEAFEQEIKSSFKAPEIGFGE